MCNFVCMLIMNREKDGRNKSDQISIQTIDINGDGKPRLLHGDRVRRVGRRRTAVSSGGAVGIGDEEDALYEATWSEEKEAMSRDGSSVI